jgi:superfamily I DNA/RNA helicase
MTTAHTAVVVMAYGTPRSREDILPYYTDIRRGRAPTPELLKELEDRYEAIGGLSPLAQITDAQADAIQHALNNVAPGEYHVVLGLKHAKPFVEDAVHEVARLGIKNIPKLGHKIRKSGLNQQQLALPLFQPATLFPSIRQETIHQVKGESIDAVLVLGSPKFFNSVVSAIESGENTEERRLAYVAMTRARHALVLGLPSSHYDKHAAKWVSWGFKTI